MTYEQWKEKYDKFLKTEYWESLKQQMREFDGDRCQICGKHGGTSPHHTKYKYYNELQSEGYDFNQPCDREHFFNERNHLILLCEDCHSKHHKMIKALYGNITKGLQYLIAVTMAEQYPNGWEGKYPGSIAALLVADLQKRVMFDDFKEEGKKSINELQKHVNDITHQASKLKGVI